MKLFYCLCTALLLHSIVFAQKVDIDPESIPVHYLKMPTLPFPPEYNSYSTKITSKPGDLSALGFQEATIENYLVVPGFSKTSGPANFSIELKLGNFSYTDNAVVNSTSTTTKDKAGKVTTTYTYYVVINYQQNLSVHVRDDKNTALWDFYTLSFPREYKSGNFNTHKDAYEFSNYGLRQEVAKQAHKEVLSELSNIKRTLASKYGYAPTREQAKLWILDSDKHPEYQTYQDAFKVAKSAFSLMHANKSLDTVRLAVRPAMDVFFQKKDSYDVKEKSGRKMRYSCLFNLSTIYFWLENFEEAAHYANELIINDYDGSDGKRILEDIEEKKAALKKCGHNSAHFEFPKDTYIPQVKAADPAPVAAAPAPPNSRVTSGSLGQELALALLQEKAAEPSKNVFRTKPLNAMEEPGMVYLSDGRQLKGAMVLDGPVRYFGDQSNTQFFLENDDKTFVSLIDFNQVSKFSIGSRMFLCIPYKSAVRAYPDGVKAKVEILEVIYQSAKIVLYLAYTADRRSLDSPPEYAVLKVADNETTSLNGYSFSRDLKKGLKKTFGDCKPLLEVLDKEELKRNNTDMIRLAKILESCW